MLNLKTPLKKFLKMTSGSYGGGESKVVNINERKNKTNL
jgi:hypothetical protein